MDLSFSGAGFMGTYYIGVLDCWSQFVARDRVCRAAGASAGSLTAAYYLMDLPLTSCLNEFMALIESIRERPLGVFDRSHQIVDLLPVVLNKLFPDDCHKRVNGKLFVAMTRLKDMKKIIISEFESKQDVIDALNCSCFIPIWSGNHVSKFRNAKYIDGGFTDNLPVFDDHTIRVCCFSGQSDISPCDKQRFELLKASFANTPVRLNVKNLRRLGKALFPPPPTYILELLQRGFHDTRDFLLSNDLIQCNECYAKTAPEQRHILTLSTPTITPRASPLSSRTTSVSEQTKPNYNLNELLVSNNTCNNKQNDETLRLVCEKLKKASKQQQDEEEEEEEEEEEDNRVKRRKKMISRIFDHRKLFKTNKEIKQQIPTIVTTNYDQDNIGKTTKTTTTNQDKYSKNGDERVNDENNNQAFNCLNKSETIQTNTYQHKQQQQQQQNNDDKNKLATGVKFSLAPSSCPPSPSLNRYCKVCLQLRQNARNAVLSEELVQIALKFDKAAQAKANAKPSKKLATGASPLKWLKGLSSSKNSYNLQASN